MRLKKCKKLLHVYIPYLIYVKYMWCLFSSFNAFLPEPNILAVRDSTLMTEVSIFGIRKKYQEFYKVPHYFKQYVRKETSFVTGNNSNSYWNCENLFSWEGFLIERIYILSTQGSTGCSVNICQIFPYKLKAYITIMIW